ncbi:MAG: Crp/Fnr family transcriptional regulator [Planctomycetota bacterium]|nr:MAG: Crp/Fnr family transcriptional regulator [Planctomycetota bacterium]REJ97847.1 MAG: Crp/Fnr family transcriptional regulator [Planctomycetota bacterium]
MSKKLWYLKQCRLFERLPPHELDRLEVVAKSREFARRSPIYLPADEADAVLLLAQGRAKICSITGEGKQAILAFIDPGEVFGELAVLSDAPREEYAEAIDDSTVVLIPRGEMQRLMEDYGHLALSVTKLIGFRRRTVERRLKSLLFRSNRERLCHLLLELAEQYGRPAAEGLLLDIRLSHQDLASVIGSTRETVTVVLGELQNEQKLKLGRRRITITDVKALAASVQHGHIGDKEGQLGYKLSRKIASV